MSAYLKHTFDNLLPDAEKPETWYVCLMQEVPFYGGPEEGGWWGSDTFPVAVKQCFNKREAEQWAERVKATAATMSEEARQRHGQHCSETLDWLDARGLEPDFLPEPDGEESYYVIVSQGIPEPQYGSRRYE